jgi:hypothetical protein
LLSGAPVGLLFEGRFTYLFGGVTAPVAPYVQLGIGVGQYDAAVTVPVLGGSSGGSPTSRQCSVAGHESENCVQAWALGGPFYVAPAGGVRLGFSGGKIGLMLGVRPVIAVGTAFTFSIEPEVGFHFGF